MRTPSDFAGADAEMRRASLALGLIFVGVIVSLLLGYLVEQTGIVADILMLLVGFLTLQVLGWPAKERILGGLPKPSGWLLGVGGGLVGYAIASAYVWLLFSMAELGDDGWLEEMDPGEMAIAWWSVVLVAPLLEEWLMRGIAWEAMTRIGGTRATLLVTSALFALMHGLNGAAALEYPHRFAAGLVFGWLRLKTGSLIPPIVAHMVLNGLATWMG